MELRNRYHLELQIRSLYDIQALPGVLIDALMPYLDNYGRAFEAMPHYGKSDGCLTTISLENKVLHLQHIKVGIVLYDLAEGIQCIRRFVIDSNIENLSRLKFRNEHYNLLNTSIL